jgi:hypothetical protein
MPVTITRTYELFAIRWADGSRWSPYDSADEAQGQIDRASREGEVERRTFDVSFDEAHAGLYNPGIAEIRASGPCDHDECCEDPGDNESPAYSLYGDPDGGL